MTAFRSLAVIQNGCTQLISRNGNPFNSFSELRKQLTLPSAGRRCWTAKSYVWISVGKPQFRDLLFHRGEPCFFAFDLLMSDGKDLRMEKLADRSRNSGVSWQKLLNLGCDTPSTLIITVRRYFGACARWRIHALGSLFRTNPIHFDHLSALRLTRLVNLIFLVPFTQPTDSPLI